MDNHFALGCFGSAVLLRPAAAECSACPRKVECVEAVRASQSEALETVDRLGKLLGSSRTDEIARWWTERWTPNKRVQRSQERTSEIIQFWSSQGINPQLLRHRLNPVQREGKSMASVIFQFMIDARAFKPRDIVEHIRDSHPQLSKASVERGVKRTIEALLELQIIRKEGHVYCL